MLQKAAYDDLESALAGGANADPQQTPSGARPGTASNRLGTAQKPGSKMGPRK